MFKKPPTRRNLIWFAVLFQVYPTALAVVVHALRPDSKPLGYVGIFTISQLILFALLANWKTVPQTQDEREEVLRLKVQAAIARVTGWAFIATCALHFLFYREMPAYVALTLVGTPAVLMEAYANFKYRQI